jgi:hypothetical protein
VITFLFLILTLAATTTLARTQDNYEIQVYGSDLVDPGYTIVELHSNFTIDGSKTVVDGVYATNHASMRPLRSHMVSMTGSSAAFTFSLP